MYILLCFLLSLLAFSFLKKASEISLIPMIDSHRVIGFTLAELKWNKYFVVIFVMWLKRQPGLMHTITVYCICSAFGSWSLVIAFGDCFVVIAIIERAHSCHLSLNLPSRFPLTFGWCVHPVQLNTERTGLFKDKPYWWTELLFWVFFGGRNHIWVKFKTKLHYIFILCYWEMFVWRVSLGKEILISIAGCPSKCSVFCFFYPANWLVHQDKQIVVLIVQPGIAEEAGAQHDVIKRAPVKPQTEINDVNTWWKYGISAHLVLISGPLQSAHHSIRIWYFGLPLFSVSSVEQKHHWSL